MRKRVEQPSVPPKNMRKNIKNNQAKEAMARFASFPEFNPNPVIEVDLAGTIHYVNPAATELFPDLQDAGIHHPFLVHLDLLAAIFKSDDRRSHAREIKVGDIWYEQVIYFIRESNIMRFYCRDITERKRAEEALLNATEELENRIRERTVELMKINEELEAEIAEHKKAEDRITTHNTLLQLFSHSFSRKEYLDKVQELIRKWSGCRCAGLRILDKSGNIPYESYTGFSHEFWESENCLSVKKDQCACVRVVLEKPDPQDLPVMTPGGSFYSNNTLELVSGLTEIEKTRFRGTCVRNGFLSVAVIPIRYSIKVLGAIHLADEREGMVPLKTVEFIEMITPLIGEAIYRFSIEEELRQHYEALQRSETSLSEAQRIAHLGNWEWDMETNELCWSEEIYRIFGLIPEESCTTYVAFLNYVHPDDREFVKNAINEAIYERKPYNIEHRILLADGTVRIVHEQGEVKFAKTGEPVRMVGTVQDITERKRAEDELTYSREQLRNLSMYLQSAREEERTYIAREIHDELGQVLTALKMDLSWLANKNENHETLFRKTKSMVKLVDSTIQTVKRISSELRPGVLDHLGLSAAIEWQAEEIHKRTGIIFDMSIHPEDIILDRHHSTTIFRIFQEALTNVVRHAKATKVKVSLEEKDKEIVLGVIDNGKGITKKQISDPRSFGLIGIQERVYFLGGNISISGVRNKGTSITISIPLEKNIK